MTVEILHGDALDILPTLSGMDSCVTDPPYGLEFMGVAWDSFNVPKGRGRAPNTWGDFGSKEHPTGRAVACWHSGTLFCFVPGSWT